MQCSFYYSGSRFLSTENQNYSQCPGGFRLKPLWQYFSEILTVYLECGSNF